MKQKKIVRVLNTRLEEHIRMLTMGTNSLKADGKQHWNTATSSDIFKPTDMVFVGTQDQYGVRLLPSVNTACIVHGYNPNVLLAELHRMRVTTEDGTVPVLDVYRGNLYAPFFAIVHLAAQLNKGMYKEMLKDYVKPDFFM